MIPDCQITRDSLLETVKVHTFPQTLPESTISLMNSTDVMIVDHDKYPQMKKMQWYKSKMGYSYFIDEHNQRNYAHRYIYRNHGKYISKNLLDLRRSNFKIPFPKKNATN